MVRFIWILLLATWLEAGAQCAGTQSFSLTPAPPAGGYSPGTTVTVCYSMQNWNGTLVQSNWLEGFSITLGPGWTGLTPSSPPTNCSGNGNWLWLLTSTSASTGLTVGPGWFFNSQQGCSPCNNSQAGDDWGDFGTSCNWTFCFTVTVSNSCSPQNLLIQVTAGADGSWGSWSQAACPIAPFQVYNGNSNPQLPSLGTISHN